MHFFFFDDSKQNKPGRTNMGSLVAIGGIAIKKDNVNQLEKDLTNCLETIEAGTTYIKPDCIALNVLSANSKYIRLLQAADLVTSCTLALVSGENTFSPKVFEKIKPLFDSEKDRIGGVGLKIHPDFKYANLYHWLVGDTHFVRSNAGIPLPLSGRPYSKSPN